MFPRVAFAHRKVTLMSRRAVMCRGWVSQREYLAAQGQSYMLACKSCRPRLSPERQSSESWWFSEGRVRAYPIFLLPCV